MNKSELIATIADDTGIPKTKVGQVVDHVIAGITDTLVNRGEVSIAGLGSFKAVARAAREGRNPLNGEKLKIAARTVPKFTPAKALKDAVASPSKKPTKKK